MARLSTVCVCVHLKTPLRAELVEALV